MTDARTVLLIHGGLWEDTGADWFWRRTGIADGLRQRGLTVLAPDRLRRAASWPAEARHLAAVTAGPDAAAVKPRSDDAGLTGLTGLTVVAGSFGCAAAARLVLDFPGLAGRLLLAWPASPADAVTVRRVRAALSEQGASPGVLDALLGGGTLPGTADAELTRLTIPVGIVPAVPPNPLHPRSAVDALLRLPSAAELPGCPEAPQPEFAARREVFLDAVTAFSGD